jgi:ligand-binding sensor domain-containing protein
MRITFILFLCSFLWVCGLHAQPIQLSNIRSWGSNEGLSNKHIRVIAEDTEGFIWLGTLTGLVRFDGRTFVNFKQIAPSHPLGFDMINSILVIKNTIWVSSTSGLYQLSSKNYTPRKICLPLGPNNCTSNIAIDQMLLMHTGSILFDGTESGIWLMDSIGRFNMLKNPFNQPFAKTRTYAKDQHGNIWFCNANSEILCFDPKTLKFIFAKRYTFDITGIYYTPKFGLTVKDPHNMFAFDPVTNKFKPFNNNLFTEVNTQLKESDSSIWHTRNRNELYYFHKNQVIDFSHFFTKMEEPGLIRLTETRIKDHLWVGTNYGLLKADVSNYVYPFFSPFVNRDPRGLSHGVRGMAEVKNKDIYFGSYMGLFKIPYPYQSGQVERVLFDSIEEYIPYCLSVDSNFLWIGSEGGGLSKYYFNTKVHKRYMTTYYPYNNKFITSLYNSSTNQQIILGTYEGILLFNKKTEKFTRISLQYKHINFNECKILQINAINNYYWICTSRGLLKCNLNFKVIDFFDFNKRQVPCLYYDSLTHNVWAGTLGGGLFCITPEKKIINYSFKDGLSDDNVASITPYKDKLYIGTYFGLSLFNPKEKTFNNIHTQQGICHNEFNHAASFTSSSGHLFIGGVNGYNIVNAQEESLSIQTATQTPFITSIYLLNGEQETYTYNSKSLPYIFVPNNNKVIELEFGMSDYHQPEKCVYAYKIEGMDNNWIYLGNRNSFRITGLKAGNYKLLLKSAGSTGNWNEMPQPITITVDQKMYLKWWFILLEVLAVIIAGVSFYFIKLNQVKRMFNLRLQISSDLHDEVGSILTAVGMQAEVLQHVNPNNNNNQLQQIAETSRQAVSNMRDVVWSIDGRNDKVVNLVDRMSDYLLMMFENTDVQVEFNPEVTNQENILDLITRQNTYLIFKESINNIVKHSQVKNIKIVLNITPKMLFMEISSDGVAYGEAKPGMGINNIKMRALKMKADLTIDIENHYKTTLKKLF